MLCKDLNVILGAFKLYNVQQRHLGTLFLTLIIDGFKLDSEIRNTESYSSFRKTSRKL